MIDRDHDLPLTRQAQVLRLSRSSLYYLPQPVSAEDLTIMGRIDKLHLDFPFAGSRMLRDFLRGEGFKIGRCHVIPVPANREFSMNAAVLRELERLDAA